MVLLQPLEQKTGIVLRDFYLRKFFENVEKRPVGFLVRVFDDMVEIPDGLVIMNSYDKIDCFHSSARFKTQDIMFLFLRFHLREKNHISN
jgi:hypothetical protein